MSDYDIVAIYVEPLPKGDFNGSISIEYLLYTLGQWGNCYGLLGMMLPALLLLVLHILLVSNCSFVMFVAVNYS